MTLFYRFRVLMTSALVVAAFLSFSAFGVTVNRVNGGATVGYVDFSVPGDVIPLEIVRTYNSITALSQSNGWNGAFGWGWTSDFETTVTVTPERYVLLRDGNSGNNVIFRPQKIDKKAIESFIEQVRGAYFARKKGRIPTPAEMKRLQLPGDMVSKLKTDPVYRKNIAVRYNLKISDPEGEVLVSSRFGFETIEKKGKNWVRSKNGVTYTFDGQGRLVKKADRNGFFLEYRYSPTNRLRLQEIVSRNKTASLRFTWRGNRIARISDNRGVQANFAYDKLGNLIKAVDSNKQTYLYKYLNKKFPHLLTRIDYPGQKIRGRTAFRLIDYDKNGLVIKHRDKEGREARLTYGRSPNNPKTNFWTRTLFRYPTPQPREYIEERYEEFFLKGRTDGSNYLYKTDRSEKVKAGNSRRRNKTTTIYTACCGKPLQINDNGVLTKFKYYENGLLREKNGPKDSLKLVYDDRFFKVKQVNRNGFVSNFEYDGLGNLVKASNSRKKAISLAYDSQGRITQIQSKKGDEMVFEYGNVGKPTRIAQKGVGIIRIKYDGRGKIRSTKTLLDDGRGRSPSMAESQRIVRQVMGQFHALMDVLRPAAELNDSKTKLGSF